jgi:hypothetical protein
MLATVFPPSAVETTLVFWGAEVGANSDALVLVCCWVTPCH